MAASKTVRPHIGFTRYTKPEKVASPGGVILQDSLGFDWYVWVDTTGDLRTTDAVTAETAAFDWNAGGTIVGTQS